MSLISWQVHTSRLYLDRVHFIWNRKIHCQLFTSFTKIVNYLILLPPKRNFSKPTSKEYSASQTINTEKLIISSISLVCPSCRNRTLLKYEHTFEIWHMTLICDVRHMICISYVIYFLWTKVDVGTKPVRSKLTKFRSSAHRHSRFAHQVSTWKASMGAGENFLFFIFIFSSNIFEICT